MAGLIGNDWSFEGGQGSWSKGASAFFVNAQTGIGLDAYDGTEIAVGIAAGDAGAVDYDLTIESGKYYTVSLAYLRQGGGSGEKARVNISGDVTMVDPGDTQQYAATLNETWYLWPGDLTFVGTGASANIKLDFLAGGSGIWAWDAVLVQEVENVAVLLGELGRKGLLKALQDNIATELSAITTERGDSLTLLAPTHWYGYERNINSPDKVECAVYRAPDGITFPSWAAKDMSGFDGARGGDIRADVLLYVVLTHANYDNVNPSEMYDRSDRYAAAIARILRDNVRLGLDDVIYVVPERVVVQDPDPTKSSDNVGKVDRVTALIRCAQNEGGKNENQAGGGVPPAAVTETT